MTSITIQAYDGPKSFNAYLSLPPGGKGPGMVIIQEIFGVNAFVRNLCNHYASLGYVAVAPDLFWELEPDLDLDPANESDSKKAFSLFSRFDVDKGVYDLNSTIATLRAHPAVTGKIGCVGYCLGGKLAYLMATRSDVDASVGYYGVGIQDLLSEASAIAKPLLLHIAAKDSFTPPPAQEQIKTALGKMPLAEVWVYPGTDHAFARIGGAHYDETAANLANTRTEEFFANVLQA